MADHIPNIAENEESISLTCVLHRNSAAEFEAGTCQASYKKALPELERA